MSMYRFIARRSVEIVLILFIIATLTFSLFRFLPSDPVGLMMDPYATPEKKEIQRELWGLDKSIAEQYVIFMKNFLRGEFGTSFWSGKDVYDIIKERLPYTVLLFTSINVLSFSIGMYTGRIIAWKRGGKLEYSSTVLGMFFYSMPGFWICLLSLYVFSYKFELFPLGGIKSAELWVFSNPSLFIKILDILHHLFLPLTVGTLVSFSGIMLMMKNVMLDTLGEDYIITARAKGLPEKKIRDHHAARNVMLPLVTAFTLSVVGSLGGSMIVEMIFSWPGLGAEFLRASMNYDYPIAQGAFIIMGAILLVAILITEITYAYLDPRIRY
ncbi:MAG: ABC transporter permease [Theionarchaea archaeon]|nr:ABC transporter permease [Theionarchaea archaeon]